MNLGLMLLRKSGKQGSLKFWITLIAAALGTLILLFVASITHAISNAFLERKTWTSAITVTDTGSANSLSTEMLLAPNAVVSVSNDSYQTFLGMPISEYILHFTGGSLPKGSPLDTYPAAGEYYVSPALAKLMNDYPSSALRDRFPGKWVGIIPERSLSSPDQLMIIGGSDVAALSDTSSTTYLNAKRVTDFTVSAYGEDYQKQQEISLISAMGVGAVGLIVPVMMLITTATMLGARERESRYAALRLVGATKRQIRNIAFIDSLLSALLGVVLGCVLFLLLRPIAFSFRMQSMRFFPQEIVVTPMVFGLIVLVVVALVWLANNRAMRQAVLSPLGVSRQQKLAKAPRILSIVPLILSICGLAYFGTLTQEKALELFGDTFMLYILGLFMLMLFGLLLAGGWLTKLYGIMIGQLNKRASGVLVSRRIRYEARTIFRGIGGIVIAFFAGAFFITAFSTISNLSDQITPAMLRSLPDNSIMINYTVTNDGIIPGYVTSVQKAIMASDDYDANSVKVITSSIDTNYQYLSCVDAERVVHRSCAESSKFVKFKQFGTIDTTQTVDGVPGIVDGKATEGNASYIEEFYLPVNGRTVDTVAAETIVTKSTVQGGMQAMIVNQALRNAGMDSVLSSLKYLLYAGIIVTVIVASLNLVVATVAGLFDRKASFFTLRLGGAELSFLKQIVTSESMLPLVFISLISIAAGMWVAYVFLSLGSITLGKMFVLPEPLFWVCVAGVFVLTFIGIKLILPMLNRLTAIDENRTE